MPSSHDDVDEPTTVNGASTHYFHQRDKDQLTKRMTRRLRELGFERHSHTSAAGRVLDRWRSTPAAAPEPKAEIDSIRQAVGRGDRVALEAYGDLNGTLRRMRDLSAAVTGRPAIASGQIWRSMQVPT